MELATCADDRLADAMLRMVDIRGQFIGTAFVASLDGTCLTCRHVLEARPHLRCIDRHQRTFDIEIIETPGVGDSDIGCFRLLPSSTPFPPPLPLLVSTQSKTYRTRLWIGETPKIKDPLPLAGDLPGLVTIEYERHKRQYRNHAYTLSGGEVLDGASGSPIVDPALDAVVGIATSRFNINTLASGFAVTLNALANDPQGAKLLQTNAASIERFGRQPNDLAFAKVFDRVNDRAIKALDLRQVFDEKHYVTRTVLREAMARFVAQQNGPCAFPIFGSTGMGKTTSCVAAAHDLDAVRAVLLRAVYIKGHQEPIADLFQRALAQAFSLSEHAVPTLASAVAAASAASRRLLVIVDGINEAAIPINSLLEYWLADALLSAEQNGFALMFSCRLEHKDAVLNRPYSHHFFTPDTDPGKAAKREKGFTLGLFTEAEFAEARARHGLGDERTEAELYHPQTLKLAAENISTGIPSQAARTSALDTQLNRTLQRVLERSEAAHSNDLLHFCERLAREALAHPGFHLPSTASSISKAESKLIHAFVSEGLLERTASGYRFLHDAMLFNVLSRNTDPLAELSAAIAARTWKSIQPEILSRALERQFLAGQFDLIRNAIGILSSSLQDKQIFGFDVPDRLIARLPLHDELDAAKTDYLNHRLAIQGPFLDPFEPDAMDQAFFTFSAAQLRLVIREFMLRLEGYGWRWKDLAYSDRRMGMLANVDFNSDVNLLSKFLRARPDLAGQMFIDFLDDKTPLTHHAQRHGSSEATVGSLAACVIFSAWHVIGLQRLWQDVIAPDKGSADALAKALAQAEPAAVSELLESRAATATTPELHNILQAINAIAELKHLSPDLSNRLARIAALLFTREDLPVGLRFELAERFGGPGIRDTLVNLAERACKTQGNLNYLARCVALYELPYSHMRAVAADMPDRIFAEKALQAFTLTRPRPWPVIAQLLKILREDPAGLPDDSWYGLAIEDALYRLDLNTARQFGVLQAAVDCIRTGNEKLIIPLIIFAVWDNETPERRELAEHLMRELASPELPQDLQNHALHRCARFPTSCQELLRALLSRRRPDRQTLSLILINLNANYVDTLTIFREVARPEDRPYLDSALLRLQQSDSFETRREIADNAPREHP